MNFERMEWGAILAAAHAGRLPGVMVGADAAMVANVMGGHGFAYLATPYSRECLDADGLWSFEESTRCAHRAAVAVDDLRRVGVAAVSPIVLSHAMIAATGQFARLGHGAPVFAPVIDPLDGAMWLRWCLPIVQSAGCIVVPAIDGWDKSHGIKSEVRAAIEYKRPVFLYAAPDLGDR